MLSFTVECIELIQHHITGGRFEIVLSSEDGSRDSILFETDWSDKRVTVEHQYSFSIPVCSRVTAKLKLKNSESLYYGSILVDDASIQGIVLYSLKGDSPVAVVTLGVKDCPSESRRPSGSIPSEPAITKDPHDNLSVTSDILAHFFSDISTTKQLIETYKRWSIRCGPLRFAHDSTLNVFKWVDPTTTLLIIVIWSWICLDSRRAISLLLPLTLLGALYLFLLVRTGACRLRVLGSPEEFKSEDIEINLQFNNRLMSKWCDLYDHLAAKSDNPINRIRISTQYISVAFITSSLIYLLPTNYVLAGILVLPLIANCPSIVRKSYSITSIIKPEVRSNTQIIEVYENQRWWLGSWSDKGLAIGTAQIFPWSDVSGKTSKTKSDQHLPPGYEWIDLWHVDDQGWTYAINFEAEWFHGDQRSSDFVRKRRWIRTAVRNFPIDNE